MLRPEKWEINQSKQRNKNDFKTFDEGVLFYEKKYKDILNILKVTDSLDGKKIIEVGSGDFPLLYFCKWINEKCMVIEPNVSQYLIKAVQNEFIDLVPAPAEEVLMPKVDEVWLFNVLRYCINPEMILRDSFEASKTVRIFEAVGEIKKGVDEFVLHSFEKNDFEEMLAPHNVVPNYCIYNDRIYCYA